MDSQAIKIKEQGPPSVMNLEQETIGSPGEEEVLALIRDYDDFLVSKRNVTISL